MLPYIVFLNRPYPLYGLLGVVALFVATGVVYPRAKREGLVYVDLLLGIVVLGVGLLIGGTILHAMVRIPFLWEHRGDLSLFEFLRIAFGGLVFYGGIIGVLIAMPLYAKSLKKGLSDIVLLTVPLFPLAHGIMRIGCFMAGCCYGVEHDNLGIAFTRSLVAPNNVRLLSVQLFETITNFFIFIALWKYTENPRRPLVVLCFYGLSYAIIRFMLEFLRGDEARGFIFGFSTSQFISIFVVIFCISALICEKTFIQHQ